MATLYEEPIYVAREIPISEYLYRDVDTTNYAKREEITSNYDGRDLVYNDSDKRITCGKRYKCSELTKSWSFYHVSWRLLSGGSCTNYVPRVVPSE